MVSAAASRAGASAPERTAAYAARRKEAISGNRMEPPQAGAGIPLSLLRSPCHLEVMIPARNEAMRLPHSLGHTLQYLEAQPYSSSLVVIDNGSADDTVDLVSRTRSKRVAVDVIGCAERGKGSAVRRGILTSRARFVGYMDADLATPIETLDLVLPLLEGGYQAVVGSRHVNGAVLAERQPTNRVLGGMVFRAMVRHVLPGIADTQCGFKFFSGGLAQAVARDLHLAGFAFDIEFLRRVIELGMPVKEIPVVWSDGDGSTLHLLRDGAHAAMDVLRLARRGI
jgi:dolichyl-phosphate beta-glucosyltransferase